MRSKQWRGVVGSGAVGPEPINSRASPGVSLIIRPITRAGDANCANLPPFNKEVWRRMALTSATVAP